LLLITLVGCARQQNGGLRYGEVLNGAHEPEDVASQLRVPSAECVAQAIPYLSHPRDMMPAPLPAALRARSDAMLRGLHPIAKQVLRHTGGVWFARDIPGAAARFIPCDADDGRRGWVLIDATDLPGQVRDSDLPQLYWQLLGGTTSVARGDDATASQQEGLRYVLLHELGHALSLLAGEFTLSAEKRFEIDSWDGFLAFSWRARGAHAVLGRELHDSGGVVPSGLGFADWRHLRLVLDGQSTWLAPSYRRSDVGGFCSLVKKLPRAGFVTPAAALAPTEDYAELFAHAILAAEGKIRADEVMAVSLEGCPTEPLATPYFSSGVSAKRLYIEEKLGLR
jgi:hypothetical protein